jgi:hypothetical protein
MLDGGGVSPSHRDVMVVVNQVHKYQDYPIMIGI